MRYLIAYAFVFLSFGCLFGQANVLNSNAAELLEQLDLSHAQKDQINHLKLKYKDLFDHVARSTPDRAVRMKKRKQLQKDLRMEMKAVLTPSQQRKLGELTRQAREQQQKPALTESIDWVKPTKAQQEQIQALLKDQRTKVRKVRQSDLSAQKRRTELGNIRQETIEQLRGILTADQFNEFQDHVKTRIRQKRN